MIYWLLTSEFPPLYGGGISTYSVETAKMFSAKGDTVTVFTPNYSIGKLKIEQNNKFRVVFFNPDNYYTTSFLGFEANLSFAFSQVVKEVIEKEGSPDIIESQEYLGIAYYLLQFKWLQYPVFKDLKVIITLHAPSFLYWEYNKVPLHQLPYFWIGEMERFCIISADMLISPSQYLVDEIKSRVDINNREIAILKNPYEVSWVPEKANIKKNKIVFFGKLIPQKGCIELITYFTQLWDKGFEHPLLMIGGGNNMYHPEGIDMIDFIKQKYKPEIQKNLLKLLGSVPPDQIYRHLQDAHIVVIPSIVDNLPYTVIEAMSHGKIVLASVQGGQSELIENSQDGFLFDHKDKNSFQNQIHQVLSLNDDSISAIGQRAFNKIVDSCSFEKVYDQKIVLINQLLKKKEASEDFPLPGSKSKIQNTRTLNDGTKNLLSVVIPYYNMGKYVEDALKSIRNSSCKNIEIILVNDGSNEKESVDILDIIEEKYKCHIIHKSNEGLPTARNDGAKYAKGEYLAFLDPDDTIEADYYEKALLVLNQFKNIYFVGCWAKYFGNSKGYWPSFNPEPPYLLVHNMINSSALVYKKHAFLAAGLNDPELVYGMEDYESVINMLKNGYHGVALPEPLWNYRIRKNSLARAFTKNKQLYLYRLISEKHKTYFSIFAADIANILNANGPGINYDNPTLLYNFPGKKLFSSRLNQFIIKKIKSNAFIRKVAIRIKRML
jgi:glycosyltransferase involved in cell wall biosynthesis